MKSDTEQIDEIGVLYKFVSECEFNSCPDSSVG